MARALIREAAALEAEAKELRHQGRHAEAFQLELRAHETRFDAEHDILGCGEDPHDNSWEDES